MNQRLELYKEFIDDIVGIREGVLVRWITTTGYPKTEKNEKINELLCRISNEDKALIAEMIGQARDGGFHDVLVYLNDNLQIHKGKVELAEEPYGTTMYWDWVSRSEGDEWPEDELDEEY